MATNFPTNLDTYPTVVNNVDDVMGRHVNNPGDAIEALEAKIGIDASAVTNSFDYLIKNTSGGHNHDGSNSRLLSYFKTGDFLLSSVTTTRDNWTEVSSSYSNAFIRINATPNLTITGTDSHSHSPNTYSASDHTHGVGSYTGPSHTHTGSCPKSTSSHRANSGGGQFAHRDHTHSYTTGSGGAVALTGSSASGGSGTITGTSGTTDHIPTYVTCAVFKRI